MADGTLSFDINATDHSSAATSAAARGFEKLGLSEEAAAKAADNLQKQAAQAERKLASMGREASQLTRKLIENRVAVAALANEISRTGKVELLPDLKRKHAEIRDLENALKHVSTAGGKSNLLKDIDFGARSLSAFGKQGTEAAGTFASAFEGGLISSFKALPPEAQAAMIASFVGVAIAAVPAVVALMDTALAAGIGFGGLAAGIALAARDPVVANAFKSVGRGILETLTQAVTPIKHELVDTAEIFRHAFSDQAPAINRIFAGLSTAVQPIAHGLADAFTNAMPGLEKVFAASLPLLKQFGAELPKIGQLMGDLFDSIAQSGPTIQATFQFILLNVEALIRGIQALVDVTRPATNGLALLGQAFGLVDLSTSGTAHSLGGIADSTGAIGDAAIDASHDFDALISKLSQTTATADTVAGAMTDKLLNTMLSLDQATLGFAESQTRLQESFKDNGKNIDISTAKGQANREAVLGSVRANQQQYDALIASGVGAETAAAAYGQNTAALETNLRKAGLNKGQIDQLIGSYRNVPANVNTAIAINGLEKAIANLEDTLRLINGLKSREITITTKFVKVGNSSFVDDGHGGGVLRTGQSRNAGQNAALPWGPFVPSDYASSYFQAMAAGSGGYVGSATPINNDVTVTVLVDGQELRSVARVEARQLDSRNAWRARAGRR